MLEIDILVAEKRSWHFLTKNCDFLFCLWISFSLLLLLFCFILFCLFGCFFAVIITYHSIKGAYKGEKILQTLLKVGKSSLFLPFSFQMLLWKAIVCLRCV